ncbi:LytR/AlgR family response regulator transcription factor [Streptococcus pluranimalium]|uniref:LytR/AlgR family response regulator transcription factor n=1 Tax=Streptococcus pluranimalium TaxID=82348 RepID=UPI003F69464C
MSFMIIKIKDETKKVMLSDILYIRSHPSKPHYIQIVTEAETYDCLQKLQNIEQMYPEYFIRCHRSSLVNYSKIKAINFRKKLIFLGEKGEYRITFSRRRYQDILLQWTNRGEI